MSGTEPVIGVLFLALGTPELAERPIADAIAIEGEAACVERERLAASVASWLGRDRLDARLDVVARDRSEDVAFELRRDGEVRVERTIAPAPRDCEDRQAALALAIALAIDASVLDAIVPPSEPAVAAVPAAPTPSRRPPARPEVVPTPTPPAKPSLRVALLFGPLALVEVLDHAAFGGEVGVELRPIEFLDVRIGTLAAAGLPTHLAGGSIAPALAGGRVDACPGRTFARGRLRLRLCIGIAAAAAIARGRGFAQTRRESLPWTAVLAGGETEVALGRRIGLRAHASMVAPFVRPAFVVRDPAGGVIATAGTPPLGVALGLGLSVRLR